MTTAPQLPEAGTCLPSPPASSFAAAACTVRVVSRRHARIARDSQRQANQNHDVHAHCHFREPVPAWRGGHQAPDRPDHGAGEAYIDIGQRSPQWTRRPLIWKFVDQSLLV